jgi:hypothetical protein
MATKTIFIFIFKRCIRIGSILSRSEFDPLSLFMVYDEFRIQIALTLVWPLHWSDLQFQTFIEPNVVWHISFKKLGRFWYTDFDGGLLHVHDQDTGPTVDGLQGMLTPRHLVLSYFRESMFAIYFSDL